MKKIFSKLCGGVLLCALSMSLTSCEDVLGHWEKPTPNPITPPSGGETPVTPEEIYAFSLRNMADDADITATAFNVTDQDGNTIVTAESDGKYTIKSGELSSVTTLWLEATTATGKYIAKATKEELPAIAEAGKLKMATLGDVILADGKFAVAGTEGQLAKIAYLGDGDNSDDTYNHGLALALKDVSETKAWDNRGVGLLNNCLGTQYSVEADAKGDMAGIVNTTTLVGHTHHPAAVAASEFKYKDDVDAGAHPDGTSAWFLPSAGQWQKMATAAGSYENLKTNTGLSVFFYWSSTEYNTSDAWSFLSSTGTWGNRSKGNNSRVRACLAF